MGVHFDNRFGYNKPVVEFLKVKNDLGAMMIYSGFYSPHKNRPTHIIFLFFNMPEDPRESITRGIFTVF